MDRRTNDPLADIPEPRWTRIAHDDAPIRTATGPRRTKTMKYLGALYHRRADDCVSACVRAQEQVAAVNKLHAGYRREPGSADDWCECCNVPHPCRTIRAMYPDAVSNTAAREREMGRDGAR